ncbi:hypothetical protein [Streptomyces sp. NBC_01294]|uniref:hypothetical protein n=1 Tax=Streptomyces sp. NBC_01294 TaxID=2903815 RepID=UPI002DD8C907|nr:hypothetical protein [Streptomyces sp. NBC_01294]WRZ55207.1 hypothetical protein OG534_01065 [Streptomyces sp. NBC_01294]
MVSIWAAARLAGEDRVFSSSLAVALNARGTIGIVLAGVTRQAELINDQFFVVLVLVSSRPHRSRGSGCRRWRTDS